MIGALLTVPCFAGDGWKVFSRPFPIYSVAPYADGVVYGSAGGIRIKTSTFDKVYMANNGLETSDFRAVVTSPKGVYAVSEYGLVASLRGDLNGWTVLNRSYLSNGRKALPDQSKIVGNVIVITFEDYIAFFDIDKSKSILSINRIGDVSFAVFPPKVISVHGDYLYVSTGKQVFRRKMAWKNLWSDMSLIDPDSWERVETTSEVYGMAWKGDSLKMYPKAGTWSWTEDGKESSSVQDSSKILLFGKKIKESSLYKDGKSIIKWINTYSNGTAYLIGSEDVFFYSGGKFHEMGVRASYELGSAYELALVGDGAGGVLVGSSKGAFAYTNGSEWSELRYYDERGYGNMEAAYSNRMKVLSSLHDGTVLYHIWGEGFYLYSKWGRERTHFLTPDDGLCMDNYAHSYTVTAGTTAAPDSVGFLTASADTNGYSLVYISRDGEMSCLKQVGSMPLTGAILVTPAKNGVDWDVYVSARESPSASSSGALDIIRISPPSKNGGRLVKVSKKTLHGLDEGSPIDMSLDKKNELLWMVTTNKLGYYDIDQDTIKMPASVSGLSGAEYTSIGLDPHHNVWVGTTAQGVYRLSRKGKSFDTLTTQRFTSRNGMLSDAVDDIAIDPEMGVLWAAHEQGLSWYKRNDLRANESFMTDSATTEVLAFPNPFRPKIHRYISFDFLAEDATLSIYNRGGALIRFFRGEDMYGGRVDWDGTDKSGKLVVPGVYYYVVKNSKKTKKGKFIIIH